MGLNQLRATPYDFTVFWGIDMIVAGVDTSGGAGNAFVTDANTDFVERGVVAGSPIRNMRTGGEVLVAGVANFVLQTPGLLWDGGDEYNIAPMDLAQYRVVDLSLQKARGEIAMSLRAAGISTQPFSSDGADYLRNLMMLIAVVVHNAPCKGARIDPAQRAQYMEWIQRNLGQLRDGTIEVVAGHTGAEFPAFGVAQQSLTEWGEAQMIYDRMRRR
jgi:hypothetical protein